MTRTYSWSFVYTTMVRSDEGMLLCAYCHDWRGKSTSLLGHEAWTHRHPGRGSAFSSVRVER